MGHAHELRFQVKRAPFSPGVEMFLRLQLFCLISSTSGKTTCARVACNVFSAEQQLEQLSGDEAVARPIAFIVFETEPRMR